MDDALAKGVLLAGMMLVSGVIIYLVSDDLCVCGVPVLVALVAWPIIKLVVKLLPKLIK